MHKSVLASQAYNHALQSHNPDGIMTVCALCPAQQASNLGTGQPLPPK